MKILLLAPHPFYQERGTPIAVDLLVRALADLGHSVDVLTYHEGQDRPLPAGVTVHRVRMPGFIRGVRPGFSWKKLLCDAAMLPRALRLARQTRYDVVHAVEESVFIAMAIGRRTGTPYVYDMDSSMPQQLIEKMPLLRVFRTPFEALEAHAIRGAAAVVPVCDALAEIARRRGARRVVLLRDMPLNPFAAPAEPAAAAPTDVAMPGTAFLYVGNLERYQGIDLLLESFAAAAPDMPNASLVVVGGTASDVAACRQRARDLGLAERARFVGPRPLSAMARLFEAAAVLVSPRVKGLNTPMKIYSYLAAGRPILATDIASHTQVLDASVALLASPQPDAFAAGMRRLYADPALRVELAARARERAQERYSPAAFGAAVAELYPREVISDQ